jgi:hypothetical protein
MGRSKENKVQAAIMGALEVYCQTRSLQLFPPYANQQGGRMRQYCTDLIGVVEGADLIALEVKELNVDTGELHQFDQDQHEIAKEFETLGVPLAYAYNAVERLPYHERPKPQDWAAQTLALVKRSAPTPLPGSLPDTRCHQSLLDWLNGSHGSLGVDLFGKLHGMLEGVEDLRNGVLVLLYSVPQQTVAALQPVDIFRTVKTLRDQTSHLTQQQFNLLEKLLGASADIFNRFLGSVSPEATGIHDSHSTPDADRKSDNRFNRQSLP